MGFLHGLLVFLGIPVVHCVRQIAVIVLPAHCCSLSNQIRSNFKWLDNLDNFSPSAGNFRLRQLRQLSVVLILGLNPRETLYQITSCTRFALKTSGSAQTPKITPSTGPRHLSRFFGNTHEPCTLRTLNLKGNVPTTSSHSRSVIT